VLCCGCAVVRGDIPSALGVLKRVSADNNTPLPTGSLVLTRRAAPASHPIAPNTSSSSSSSAAQPSSSARSGSDSDSRKPLLRPASSRLSSEYVFTPILSEAITASTAVAVASASFASASGSASAQRKAAPLPFQALGELLSPALRRTTLVTWTIW
jgi:hypothetical protein